MSVTGSITASASSNWKDAIHNGSVNHGTPPGSEIADDDHHAEIDPDIVLDVVLPDGTTRQMTMNANVPMMDLLVHAAASSKLSPVAHMLVVRDSSGAVREFRPNQSIGSLSVDTVYLQPKAKMEKRTSKSDAKPFEITNRLIITLPQNQKMVLRVSLQTKLSEIFTIICSEKGLDTFIHELRHPKNRDMELDLDKTLQEYGLHEVKVVNIKAPQSLRGSDDDRSIHSTNTSEILPPSIHVPLSRTAVSTSSGWTGASSTLEREHKKKKGLKGLFKKKDKKSPKETKGDSHHLHSSSASIQDPNFILRKRQPNKIHDPTLRHSMPPEVLLERERNLQRGEQHLQMPGDVHDQTSPSSTLNRTKKRHAPAPPPGGMKTNIDSSAEIVSSKVGPMHQASLGTRLAESPKEVTVSTGISPLSASSGVSGSVDFKTEKRSQSVHDLSGAEEVRRTRNMDVATAGALVVNSKKVVKKKRRAPAPPQSPTTPTQNGDIHGSVPPKPPRAVSMFVEPTSLNLGVEKSRRPCSFIAPPPPDTPPPEDVPIVSLNGVISKSVSTSFNDDDVVQLDDDIHSNDDHSGDRHGDHVDGNEVPFGSVKVNAAVDDDNQSAGRTIDDVNLAFENVIAEAEKVMEDDKVYIHQTEMARFVESMRNEAEDLAKTNRVEDPAFGDDISLEPTSESDTIIHHGSEPHSEVSSSLDASGRISISLNGDSSLGSPKVAREESVEEGITAQVITHEECAPNFSLGDLDESHVDDHSEDVLATSNVTADSGISQSYDRQADNFIGEIDSVFDSINIDSQGNEKIGVTTSVGVTSDTNLHRQTELEMRDDVSKGTVSDIETPPIGKGVSMEILETEYDGDVSAENGAMDITEDKDVFESEPLTPKMVVVAARVESPVVVDVKSPSVESPTLVPVEPGVPGVKNASHIMHDSSPELPQRLLHESSPKEVVIESKSEKFGVALRHNEPGSNIVFQSVQTVPKPTEMVQVSTRVKKTEKVTIERPQSVRDSKVFTLGKDDEVFDFDTIRRKALAAQKEKSSGSVKRTSVAGSRPRPKSEIQKQTTEISFKPNGENEAEHVLEEKSIMMMSRPKELKSVEVKVHDPDILHPKMVAPEPVPQAASFKSSAKIMLGASSVKEKQKPEMVQIGAQSTFKKPQPTVKVKQDGVDLNVPKGQAIPLAALMAAHLPPKAKPADEEGHAQVPVVEHSAAASGHSTGASDDDPELKNQLEMLQAQFSNFQKQYEVNQSLLAKQNILARDRLPSDSDSLAISESATPQPPASPSEVGPVTVSSIPVPPPFVLKGDVKPQRKPTQLKKFERSLEPREELMIAIRNVGGRTALRKVQVNETNWGNKLSKK